MFSSLIRRRPKYITAVYVEPRKIEVLRAHRHWRTWQTGPSEQFVVSEGESIFDCLQRLNLRPRSKNGSALILFLPGIFYSFHREVYPATLQDHLDEALTYDWQENVFHEEDRTFHFFSSPVVVDHHVSVPIFSIQRNIYEKFQQVLGSAAFQDFAVIPSALAYGMYLDGQPREDGAANLQIIGRLIDESKMEIHRFYQNRLLDSLLVNKGGNDLELFRETLRCIGDTESEESVTIKAVCSPDESTAGAEAWQEDLPIRALPATDFLVSNMTKYFLDQEEVKTFDAPLLLKPWQVPKVAWYLVSLVAIFLMFASYQFYSLHRLKVQNLNEKRQVARLEAQWKPMELLQTKISKFQEDQKTLSEFRRAGYPLMEILTLLTNTTPQDTWLNYLSLRSGQLILRGESKSAIKYLSDLSKIDGFTDVRFASPVTRNPSSDLERFNLQLQVDPEKIKKTADALFPEKEEAKTPANDAVEGGSPVSDTGNIPAGNVQPPADLTNNASGPVSK